MTVELSEREMQWLLDVANEGIASFREYVEQVEADPVATEDELENAIRYGVMADCGVRVIDKLQGRA